MLSQIIYRFEAAHQSGTEPRLQDFVPPDLPDRPGVVAELVRIDLEYRRKRGLPIRVDAYLPLCPELPRNAALLRELIEAEYRDRQGRGEQPVAATYVSRFATLVPDLAAYLAAIPPPAARPITTTAALVQALAAAHLLEPPQLAQVESLQSAYAEPRPLAGELLRRGWLTAFQINQLFQGHGAELVLGPYLLLARLGEGGMGQVFQARHRKLNRLVALKLIRPERLSSPDAVRRFAREIRAAAQLQHPNVVHAIDADQVNGVHFFAMEYVEGTDLAKLVQRQGPLPIPLACDYVRQAALGLQHAHERGLVHRDIKPSNLLLARSGVVKVLDLCLARLTDNAGGVESGSTLTAEGSVMGTPDYIAPEQALSSHTVDIRADLYSLGCTLYFLLTAKPPFPGGALAEKLLRHQLREPQPVRELRPDVPAALAAVLCRLMAKQPADRYPTPAEAERALAAAQGERAVAAVPLTTGNAANEAIDPDATFTPAVGLASGVSVTAAPIKPPAGASRRRPWWIGPVAVLALVVVAALLAQWWPRTPVVERGIPPEDPPVVHKPGKVAAIDWEPGPATDVLPGLVPRPAKLPGLGRWQVETVVPRGSIYCVAYSPDGKWLACAGTEELIRVYDAASGSLVRLFQGHKGWVHAVAWNKDSRWLASAGADATVRLWDMDTNKAGPTFTGSGAAVNSVTWAPDGKRLASAGADNCVRLWEVAGKIPTTLYQGTSDIHSVAWSPDGKQLAWGGDDQTVRLWDVAAEKLASVFKGHFDRVSSLAWSPDSRQIASGSYDKTICLWEPDKQGPRAVLVEHEGRIRTLAWSPDGKRLASGGDVNQNEGVKVWEITERKLLFTLKAHYTGIYSVSWAPNGELLASGGSETMIRFLGMASKKLERTIGQDNHSLAVSWSPDGQWIATGNRLYGVHLWKSADGKLGQTLRTNMDGYGIWAVAWAPNAASLVALSAEKVFVWDLVKNKHEVIGSGRPGNFGRVAWGSDGKWLAYTDREAKNIRLWDMERNLPGPVFDHDVGVMAFDPQGRWLASAGEDLKIRLWCLADEKMNQVFAELSMVAGVISWSPDGSRLASLDHGSVNTRLYIRKYPGGVVEINQPVITEWGHGLAWSGDGRFLACSISRTGETHGVQLWDTDKGQPLHFFAGHNGRVPSISWHPKALQFVSCASDLTVRVWDAGRKEAVWVGVLLPGGHTATLQAGGRLDVSDFAAEGQLVYVVENAPGSVSLLTPREFRHRLALATPAAP